MPDGYQAQSGADHLSNQHPLASDHAQRFRLGRGASRRRMGLATRMLIAPKRLALIAISHHIIVSTDLHE